MKHAILILTLAATLLGGPIKVGSVVLRNINGAITPVIVNNTTVQWGSGTIVGQFNITFDFNGAPFSYSTILGGNNQNVTGANQKPGGLLPGHELQTIYGFAPSAFASPYTMSMTWGMLPPLPCACGVTSFQTSDGQWYVAMNTLLTLNAQGEIFVADAVPGWMNPSGLGGILPGPPPIGLLQAQANPVPEPATMLMVFVAAGTISVFRRWGKRM